MVREGLTRANATHWAAVLLVLLASACLTPPRAPTAPDEPPAAPREFRAAWVSTVANIDWPSAKGLSSQQQQAEIVRIVDRAAELHLNALVLQVRPSADAIYPSSLEPWTEFLTGEQGKAPEPPYDPLEMWVTEAHRRGLELHAWFNPYRARHKDATSAPAPTHIANAEPAVVKTYGGYLWMDPGEPAAADRTLRVILDVVHRYDVDGVHIDDYFYPYPVLAPWSLAEDDFPDEPSWQRYASTGGALSRAAWRRKNVSDLIEHIYDGVHREKNWVKSGISPFGVGRPDRRPAAIVGFSQYDKLYADVELWLQNGWLDYLSPQLYWAMDSKGQAFGSLLDYWLRQNPKHRHVWPGLFTSRVDRSQRSWAPEEVLGQIALGRGQNGADGGQVHFSMVSLLENRKGIGDRLKAGPYAVQALVPATPWLDGTAPESPRVIVDRKAHGAHGDSVDVHLFPSAHSRKPLASYALWARYGEKWQFSVAPTAHPDLELETTTEAGVLDVIVVSAVDRTGNESPRVRVVVKER